MTAVAHLAHLARPPIDTDPAATWAEYRQVIENTIMNAPRSLQTRIGPSELGASCDRCLVSKLAGIQEKREAAWLPWVGSAVHEQLELAFAAANAGLSRTRWLVESQVTVGNVGGVDITGHADLFDLELSEITDWKIVGKTTLVKAKGHGPTAVYRKQIHLYGLGFVNRGLPVSRVRIAYLPRNEPTLANAFIWSEPYDESIALAALARANQFATVINMFGAQHVLANTPPHTGEDFSCNRFPNPDGTYPTGRAFPDFTALATTNNDAPFGAI